MTSVPSVLMRVGSSSGVVLVKFEGKLKRLEWMKQEPGCKDWAFKWKSFTSNLDLVIS